MNADKWVFSSALIGVHRRPICFFLTFQRSRLGLAHRGSIGINRGGALPLVGLQDLLAQADAARGDFDEVVVADEFDGLLEVENAWRGSPTERGFSMALGRVGGRGDDQCVVATATEDGVLRAILHFVPWGSDGLSLDLMRRDRAAQPGLNDFLIVETIKNAQELGVKRVSLNFAVFRAALERGERIGAGPVLRAWRRILIFMSRWFQIESLYKFNAKFCPRWMPRFLLYPSTGDLPRIGLAALEAEAFLVWPNIGPRRLAHQLGLYRLGSRWRRSGRRPRPAA